MHIRHIIKTFENVNIEALEELEKKGVEVYPQPSVLKIIKEKEIEVCRFKIYRSKR